MVGYTMIEGWQWKRRNMSERRVEGLGRVKETVAELVLVLPLPSLRFPFVAWISSI